MSRRKLTEEQKGARIEGRAARRAAQTQLIIDRRAAHEADRLAAQKRHKSWLKSWLERREARRARRNVEVLAVRREFVVEHTGPTRDERRMMAKRRRTQVKKSTRGRVRVSDLLPASVNQPHRSPKSRRDVSQRAGVEAPPTSTAAPVSPGGGSTP